MTYKVTLSATLTVDAINVMEAMRIARKAHLVGQCLGWRYTKNNRDSIRYEVKYSEITLSKPEKVVMTTPGDGEAGR